METFAIIVNGTVVNTVLGPAALPAGATAVDITNVTPQPGIGWAYNGAAFTMPTAPVATKASTFQAAIAAGYDTGLGWRLLLDDASRNIITSGATLITTAAMSYQLAGNTTGLTAFLASNYTFTDIAGTPRVVTVQQAMAINLGYGTYYQTIWSAAQ